MKIKAILAFLLLLALAVPAYAGPAAPPEPAAPASPNQCPSGCGMPDSLESADGFPFCVYYDSDDTTLAQAQDVRDYTDDYWDVYENDYGWAMPTEYSGGKFKVCLVDNGTSCNGSVSIGTDYMTVWEGCDSSVEMMMAVVGHELAHAGPQLGPDNQTAANFDALWAHEGMARSGEDKVFDNVDNDAGAMARPFSYNKEVDEFFVSPNHDLTADSWRYESAIWWTYYAEQCGSDPVDESGLGVADSFGEFWDAAHTSDNIAALNIALGNLGCPSFDTLVPKFVLANYTKDLSGLPDDSYYYIDETNPGNPDTYGPLSPISGGTINSTTLADWTNQAITRYGSQYYVASPSATDCPVITAKFHADSGAPFYHVVTDNGGAFNTHVQGSGTDWSRSFLNDGVTTIAAIAGSLGASSQVDIELSCSDPVVDIKQPNQLAPEYVGGFADGDKFLVQVLVSTTVGGPVVGGLTANDFAVRVGALNATVIGGGQIEDQYFLQVIAPNPGVNGPFDLHVDLEESGTSTVIATDSETEAIVYDATNEDNVYVIDRSASMGWYSPTPWSALVDAINLAIDTTNSSEGLAIVPFNSNVSPAPFDMDFATLGVRNNAKTYVDGISPSGGTSIGDGMGEGAAQITGSPTLNSRCRYILLSDGEENSPDYWADVRADVQATGCPVLAIAFGPGANETLMQQIASETGGAYYYNDVYVGTGPVRAAISPADMVLDLGSTYQYAQAFGERDRLLTEKGFATQGGIYTHTVQIDPSVLQADFVLDWPNVSSTQMGMQLIKPDGTPVTTPYNIGGQDQGHTGWRIDNPEEGEWQMVVGIVLSRLKLVNYQVMVTAKTKTTARLILPTVFEQFRTGNLIPLYALVTTGQGPLCSANVRAQVTAPDGMTQTVQMQHMGGGLFQGFYTLGNQADPISPPPAEDGFIDPDPNDEGSYIVDLLVNGQGGLQREAKGAFSILEAADENNNNIPDTWEEENNVTDANGDPDLDFLVNADEYEAGTDPHDSDTDDGGESDWSEVVLHGTNPLDPSDDEVEAPEFFNAAPAAGGDIVLTYDVKAEYTKMSLYRASSPYNLLVSELPLTGVYTDTTGTLGTPYAYRLFGIDGDDHWSAVLDSETVTPAEDPIPPEAQVIVNSGAVSTTERAVTLTFGPVEDHLGYEAFSDIVEMKVGNDPTLAGADWQAFATELPWTLPAGPGGMRQVYALFKDDADNESVGPAIGMILLDLDNLYLPLITRNAP